MPSVLPRDDPGLGTIRHHGSRLVDVMEWPGLGPETCSMEPGVAPMSSRAAAKPGKGKGMIGLPKQSGLIRAASFVVVIGAALALAPRAQAVGGYYGGGEHYGQRYHGGGYSGGGGYYRRGYYRGGGYYRRDDDRRGYYRRGYYRGGYDRDGYGTYRSGYSRRGYYAPSAIGNFLGALFYLGHDGYR